MIEKAYMSEIKNYKRLPLGETDVFFLYLISRGEKSAYEILLSEKGIGRTIAYKNVHEKVKRLESFGLIEQVKERFSRRAIKYRLTAYGLFQCILVSSDPVLTNLKVLPYPEIMLDERMKKESALLRITLYQYFSKETIEAFLKSFVWYDILQNYLRETCQEILRLLEGWEINPDTHGSERGIVDSMIQDKVRNMIYQIVVTSKKNRIGLDPHRKPLDAGYTPYMSNKNILEAIEVLSQDDKFLELLKVIREDFDEGCKILLKTKI